MTLTPKLIIKLFLWALAIHVILILLTVIEVFIYSTFINPGQRVVTYELHANQSGPYIAIIVGFVMVYFIARLIKRKNANEAMLVCFGLPVIYILLDVILLVVSATDFANNYISFSLSYGTKLIAGYLALKKS